MRKTMKWLAPFAAIAVALLGAATLMATAPEVATRTPDRQPLAVRVLEVRPRTVKLSVRSQGTVAPRTESALIPEVSGQVVWISSALVSGGFFRQGEPLLRIDRLDSEAMVARARANLERARGDQEHALASLARRERLKKSDISSTSQLDDARREKRVAEAVLEERRIALAQAERDLARTEIRAPFTGRVRDEHVDLGQFISRGASIAMIYATDVVEIRLPIPDAELAFLDLPLWQPEWQADGAGAAVPGPEVVVRARFAGGEHEWRGRIVRTEGEIDRKSRMVHVVAQVEGPYEASAERPPLAVGLFVNAEILGRSVPDITVVPRSALRGQDKLMVVDQNDRLWLRDVDILRFDGDLALLRTRLAEGERVCVSPVQAIVDGMRVSAAPAAEPGPSDLAERRGDRS